MLITFNNSCDKAGRRTDVLCQLQYTIPTNIPQRHNSTLTLRLVHTYAKINRDQKLEPHLVSSTRLIMAPLGFRICVFFYLFSWNSFTPITPEVQISNQPGWIYVALKFAFLENCISHWRCGNIHWLKKKSGVCTLKTNQQQPMTEQGTEGTGRWGCSVMMTWCDELWWHVFQHFLELLIPHLIWHLQSLL